MRPISNEKREIIIEGKKRGENEKIILNWVKDISRSSITKIWKQYQKNRKPQTQTLPRKQKQTNQTTRPTNQRECSRLERFAE